MQISEVPFFQFALPVVVVVLCVFLIFAFGFKSPGIPPTLDVHDDDEKLQKAKKSGGKKLGKPVEVQGAVTGASSSKQTPVAKQPNNVQNSVKVAVLPVAEKIQNETPKSKAKKPTKKVDENANLSVDTEEVGDWMTAVSKKNRKNLVKKKEFGSDVPADSKVFLEDVVKDMKGDDLLLEKPNVEVMDGSRKEDELQDEVPVEQVAVADDDLSEISEEAKKPLKKSKKKNKKAGKAMDDPVVDVPEVLLVEEPAVVVPPVVEELEEAVRDIEITAEVPEEAEQTGKSAKKKKAQDSRKKYEECPLFDRGDATTNGDDYEMQLHLPPVSPSPKKNKSKTKSESAKKSAAVPTARRSPILLPVEVAPAGFRSISDEENRNLPSEDHGDWKQAKPSKKKRLVQREY